jgi:transcriptional regulator
MYTPEIYKNENQEEIRDFISKNGFAILVNQTDNKLWATHIPLYLDKNQAEKEILVGHISIENPQCKSLINDSDVLAIFSGAHSYISASWYDHENVSTWNYLAVHVYGKIKILNLEEAILSLKKLTDKYEVTSENPIRIENLSAKTMLQARGILAFEIEISSIEATKKLSQNRDAENYQNIISELEKLGSTEAKTMADEMKKCPR